MQMYIDYFLIAGGEIAKKNEWKSSEVLNSLNH